jgi:hypothetical protein
MKHSLNVFFQLSFLLFETTFASAIVDENPSKSESFPVIGDKIKSSTQRLTIKFCRRSHKFPETIGYAASAWLKNSEKNTLNID